MTDKKKVVLIGLHPDEVDFSHWPGLDADKLLRSLEAQREQLEELGLETALCLVDTGGTATEVVTDTLDADTYECVVVGAGIRRVEDHFLLFEKILNLVHEHAPTARIALNTGPDDTVDAVRRWI